MADQLADGMAVERQIESLLQRMTVREKVSLLSGKDTWSTVAIERLGIRSVVMTDGPHGVRATRVDGGRPQGPATTFPTGVAMAASWDPELVEQVGAALGEEARAMGCDVLLAPCVNIMRTPLAGRNFESYAEDPYLAGRIGVAYVCGVQSRGVGTSLKHFACNNQESERFRGNSVVDERTLREIYLPAFEAIVREARPWTVMCAYNRVNGVYASQNRRLLTEILREEWGFDGVVVSDWWANHTVVESVDAGLDLEMPGPAKYYGQLLLEAVHYWQIDGATIDRAVRRILRLLGRCGKLPGQPAPAPGSLNTPAHQALARRVAEESITLLKNDGDLLPLDPGRLRSIAVIGPNAAEARLGGGGSAYVEPPYRVSPLQGLRALLGERVEIYYAEGCDNTVEPPVIAAQWLVPAQGQGHGLWGEYFDNPVLAGRPALERVDAQLDCHWTDGGPAEGIAADRFSIRWTGRLVAPETGRYVMTVTNTASCRVYLDGRLLIDHTAPELLHLEPRAITASATLELAKGSWHDLRIEYVKETGGRRSLFRLCLARTYAPGEDPRIAHAAELARRADAAVVFAGLPECYETEGHDRPDWALPGPQEELIRAVAAANPRTVVVLNCGAPVAMPWVDEVPALVLAYYPGMEGGHALARILTGVVNPSGKLTVTLPRRMEDNPTFANYPGDREVRYGEGIFVGYRHYDLCDVAPLFPFGHGLSYTTFEYGELQVPAEVGMGEPLPVAVTVRNAGPVAGREVVQLYVHDVESSLPRPPKELKGFAKVSLEPGEAQTVHFTLDQRALSFYDPARGAWVAEPGEFELLVGSSSRDIRARASFTLRQG
jgi:beta-glucosidase